MKITEVRWTPEWKFTTGRGALEGQGQETGGHGGKREGERTVRKGAKKIPEIGGGCFQWGKASKLVGVGPVDRLVTRQRKCLTRAKNYFKEWRGKQNKIC